MFDWRNKEMWEILLGIILFCIDVIVIIATVIIITTILYAIKIYFKNKKKGKK